MRKNNNTPSSSSATPSADPLALARHHRETALDYLEQAIEDLRQKTERKGDGLGEKLLSARFQGGTNPYERIHMALNRAEGLATLLCQVHGWQDVRGFDLSASGLEKAVEFLEIEIRGARLLLDDFWQNGGFDAWKERQEDSAAA